MRRSSGPMEWADWIRLFFTSPRLNEGHDAATVKPLLREEEPVAAPNPLSDCKPDGINITHSPQSARKKLLGPLHPPRFRQNLRYSIFSCVNRSKGVCVPFATVDG